MSHDLLIDQLSSGLRPVRRRSIARETGWLLALGALELALFLALARIRPDMGQAIAQPLLWWKLGGPAILAAIGLVTAVRSFSPLVAPRRGLTLAAIAIGLAATIGSLIAPYGAVAPTLAERLAPAHGLGCAAAIIVLSLPMLAMLAIFMRRGASTHAEGSALAVGLAGGSWGAFLFAFFCPVNDPLYILVWYSAGAAAVTLAARLILPRYAAL